MLKKHFIVTAIGLVIGLLAIAWIRPLTSGGVSLLLLIVVTILNAVAVLVPTKSKDANKNAANRKRKASNGTARSNGRD